MAIKRIDVVALSFSMLSNMNAQRSDFQQRVDGVKRYMRLRKVNKKLENKIVKWYDYLWNNKQSLDGESALQALPAKLRAEIAISVNMEALKKVEIFKECEEGLLTELVMKLKLQVFSPGDFVCRKGDIGKELYIIKRGKLNVVGGPDNEIVFATLKAGTVFGEISVLNIAGNKNGNRRTASIRSVGYSDLFVLSKEDLWDSLSEYPETKSMLIEKGRQQLRKDNLLDEDAAKHQVMDQIPIQEKIEIFEGTVEIVRTKVTKLVTDMDSFQSDLQARLTAVEQRIKAQQIIQF